MGENEMAELEGLLAAATPGPWHAATAPHPGAGETPAEYLVNSLRPDAGRPLWVAWSADLGEDDPQDVVTYTVPLVTGDGPTSEANAALLVALVNAAPALIAAVRERDEVIAAVREMADGWRYKGEFGWGAWQEGQGPDIEGQVLDEAATRLLDLLPGIEQEKPK